MIADESDKDAVVILSASKRKPTQDYYDVFVWFVASKGREGATGENIFVEADRRVSRKVRRRDHDDCRDRDADGDADHAAACGGGSVADTDGGQGARRKNIFAGFN